MPSVATQPGGTPWLHIVGVGADGLSGLAPEARAAVAQATTVIGGARHLEMVPEQPGQERLVWPSPLETALDWIEARAGQPLCVLASGDPFWFGVGATLMRRFPVAATRVFPAPSAFSLAAARMGWPLQETRCLSVHGRPLEALRPWLHDGARLLILSRDGETPGELAHWLNDLGFGASALTVLEQLGGARERIGATTAADWGAREVDPLNTIALECRASPVAPTAPVIAASAGRPEAQFEQDGQITKREVRAVTLALLAPGRGECLWDIGAGSGSIGIEWMLADPANHTLAIEPRAERLERIARNARALGVPALQCIPGRAPEALDGLAPPDAIFIGGGLTTPGLVEHCVESLRMGGRLVANSVTVEGDAVLAAARERHGGELTRINVSRAEPLGTMSGWKPLRPVTLWSLRRS
ncbi:MULTISPECIES: bifunctional cobalt-precorrin-7 (C(5))-methyltransferase/cobalt-precorrin-6B (C(15))-methyltransferase [Thioalkalivibrio]|uniref:bifunctional cobalt-precorrin-7 (C(5))-methyltransferase/cobalt-precorrin-6B (C(15))-methyltransferase n=1 Tax=Thioalkalivibrio TaxID=106633 RepID=UPI0004780665|nr:MULTISPECIES: bifunctional cobalt-precorrin-7 (C(5))-methyltransferase/cobalt-precorrin-6B (C(15))-methyltransferase [Thioalkalivibrio]OOC49334.1 cobalamin biosynthesis bifunctional protein CbiET [Thioalkalivibrio versutus]